MLVFFLIIAFFTGIGYQLRRWLGKQRWYVGLAFVLVLYIPGFTAVFFSLMMLGTSFEVARRTTAAPVLGGLIVGALYLCRSGDWLPGIDDEKSG
jgi:amino acid transporter